MKFIISLFIAKIPVALCLVIAGYLVINQLEGWGWFLFGAFFVGSNLTLSDGKEETDKTESNQ